MTSIPPAVQQVLLAQRAAQSQKVDIALLKKGLDAQKQTGDAAVALLENAVTLQKQIADGRIDVQA